ncbi:MAG: hypothetical protein MZV49_12730 [Rhodopseudomonas palustris]|nr:hypothetical protein [Rhodopseudomonas palustris]
MLNLTLQNIPVDAALQPRLRPRAHRDLPRIRGSEALAESFATVADVAAELRALERLRAVPDQVDYVAEADLLPRGRRDGPSTSDVTADPPDRLRRADGVASAEARGSRLARRPVLWRSSCAIS